MIYIVRYPMWNVTFPVALPYVGMFLSYLAVFLLSLVLIKKDMKTKLTDLFQFKDARVVLLGLLLAVLLQVIFFGFVVLLGGKPASISFANGTLSSFPITVAITLVFVLYVLYGSFGAFAEEVAYRAYSESRIASKYGYVLGISISTLLFTLQHIHIFQANWLEMFFQRQFIYVLFFGIFVGYFFKKSNGNLWAVVAFHVLINIIDLSLPISFSAPSVYTHWIITILSFTILMIILHVLPFNKLMKTKNLTNNLTQT
ncbi:CPBP family intramembrane glutamic endopeptidase [Candidatus Bathycorpusculum sp.]|uniref:CPBP family intramembrane glutamic endopeptidase n=1 Tax=Candidatus Bathycorpusculum sp. TaxID=2994959 RepID=UPI002829AED6|nr:CPBP family intramembrane metalloprotease [Candidatus Termitimicrobium sp.]